MNIFGKKTGIILSQSEKIVLFEFLSNFFDSGQIEIRDEAEVRVLSSILADLEKELVEPFRKDYLDILYQARINVRGGERFACPCCGNFTMPTAERNSFEVCPVCYWEDDNLQFNDPTYRGGANVSSLNESRESFRLYGYADHAFAKQVRKPYFTELPANQRK